MNTQGLTIHLSFAERFPQQVSDVIRDCLIDLVPVLIQHAFASGLNDLGESARGANQIIIGAQFDPVVFDQQIRAALRAGGFKLPDRQIRHTESSVVESAATTVASPAESNEPSAGELSRCSEGSPAPAPAVRLDRESRAAGAGGANPQ